MLPRIGARQQEIVHLLHERGPLSVLDLSRELEITTVAVRHHLARLGDEGLITARQVRQPIGRPKRVFRLTEAADELFPRGYEALAATLLDQLRRMGGEAAITAAFEASHADRVELLRPDVRNLPLAERVSRLAQQQDERGYMAEWRRDGSFTLDPHHCPIRKSPAPAPRRAPPSCMRWSASSTPRCDASGICSLATVSVATVSSHARPNRRAAIPMGAFQ